MAAQCTTLGGTNIDNAIYVRNISVKECLPCSKSKAFMFKVPCTQVLHAQNIFGRYNRLLLPFKPTSGLDDGGLDAKAHGKGF